MHNIGQVLGLGQLLLAHGLVGLSLTDFKLGPRLGIFALQRQLLAKCGNFVKFLFEAQIDRACFGILPVGVVERVLGLHLQWQKMQDQPVRLALDVFVLPPLDFATPQ